MPSTCRHDLHRLDQPGHAPRRQVDLRHVAGDHRLGSEAEPGEEHLHLLGGRVLRLVEDHERVVERAAAHERQRRDLDRAALEQALHAIGVEHVVQRVVQGPQVRVHLLLQVAGQKAELLAGLHRRPRQDDAAHLLLQQVRHGLRHGEVGLARAGRTDAEDDVVLVDRLQVAALVDALGRDLAFAGGDHRAAHQEVAQLDVAVVRHQLRGRLHFAV